jgi:hypothetical protein
MVTGEKCITASVETPDKLRDFSWWDHQAAGMWFGFGFTMVSAKCYVNPKGKSRQTMREWLSLLL